MTVKIESMNSTIIKTDENESLSPPKLEKSTSRGNNNVKYEIDYINNGNERDDIKMEATEQKHITLNIAKQAGRHASNDDCTDGFSS